MKKIFTKKALLIILLLSAFSSYAQVQEAWVKTNLNYNIYSSEPELVLDANGNIISGVNGWDFAPDRAGQVSVFTLNKHTPTGNLVFKVAKSPETYYQSLTGMTVDGGGNIYCAVRESWTIDPVHAVNGARIAVYKYSPTGSVVWKKTYREGDISSPTAIAIDPAGNVYITGYTIPIGTLGALPDYMTVKWNNSGDFQWARKYDGASPGEGFNAARAIIADGSGNVYITGQSQRDGQLGYATIKYNAAGTELWAVRYTGLSAENDNALAITRDVSGFIYVTGTSDGTAGGTMATIKYNSDGAQIWVAREGSDGAEGRAIKVDQFSNVFVAGNGSSGTMALVKYNFAGSKQWAFTKPGKGHALDLDDLGNAYVSGTIRDSAGLVKLNSSGVPQWTKTYWSRYLPGIMNPVKVAELGNTYTIRFSSLKLNGNAEPYYEADLIKFTQCSIICPEDMIVNTSPGQCTGVVNYTVSITGECGSNIAYSQPSGTALPVGTTIVAVADIVSGEQCSFRVTVRDAELPQAKCKNITLTLDATGNTSLSAAQLDNGSTDNCGIQSMSASKTAFTCADIGANSVTFTVTDVNGNTNSCTATVTVQDNTPPTALCKNATVYLDALGNGVITTADIDNGSTDACGAVALSLSRTSFTCADKGTSSVTLTATDSSGNSANCNATVTVVDTLPPIISNMTISKSVLSPPNHKMVDISLDYTVTDNCGATTTVTCTSDEPETGLSSGDIGPDIVKIDDKHWQLRAERDGKGDGRVYTFLITATDGSENTSTSTLTVVVAHNIASPHSGAAVKVGSTVNFAGSFWDVAGNKHAAQWLIDDKTVVKGVVSEPSGMKNGTVTGSYKFTTPGVYKLQMNITDQKGITTTTNTNGDLQATVVVYDPNGGHTFGGGYYTSPAGALKNSPATGGDVSYGFTANYFKNATYPKGETQFNFQLGDFEFNALNFDYLVISGAKAQFKGTGKITGDQGGYAFIMTVIDGQLDRSGVDKVRMKIFNKNTGAVIYDNQPGAGDTDDPVMPVGENSIVTVSSSTTMYRTTDPASVGNLTSPLLEINVYPNPASSYFNLKVQSPNHKDKIIMQVTDVYGRLIETRIIAPGQNITIGQNYIPGAYFVRIVQGKEQKQAKLIKLN